MSYVYKLKDHVSVDDLIKLGYEYLPAELYGTEDPTNYICKIIEQPQDGHCVNQLIEYYNENAKAICSDKMLKKAHACMGIKFDRKKQLIVTDELLQMFSLWRLEFDLNDRSLYFTISDGNMPKFVDGEFVLERHCRDEIDNLIKHDIIERVDV